MDIWEITLNFFTAFGTLLSVAVAVFLYRLKTQHNKRDAARVLLMEIRSAEKTINEIKNSSSVLIDSSVMPVSSWHKFQHLFVSDLDTDELNSLNDFYNCCTLMQSQIILKQNQYSLMLEEKVRLTQAEILRLSVQYAGNEIEFDKQKTFILDDTFFLNSTWFEPKAPTQRVIRYVQNVNLISTSTCGSELKRIAKIK
jgi:hypothetical protein